MPKTLAKTMAKHRSIMAENPQIEEQQEEAIRLKALAESQFNSSKLKSALKHADRAHNLCPNLSGLTEMVTAFRILNSAKNPRKALRNSEHPFPSPELYDILGVTPFSSFSKIKTQYKKLALLLHPDKNTLKNASDEAFKLVNDAFQVFSDKGKRRDYDTKLRLALLEEREESELEEVGEETATFWTRCPKCRLRHRFEREYVGHRLVCPSCDQCFKAVEVGEDDEDKYCEIDDDDDGESVREAVVEEVVEDWEISSLNELVGKGKLKGRGEIGHKKANLGSKTKMGSVREVLEREENVGGERPIVEEMRKTYVRKSRKDGVKRGESEVVEGVEESLSHEMPLVEEMRRINGRKLKKDGGKRVEGVMVEEVEDSMSDEIPIAEEMRKITARKLKKDGEKRVESGIVEQVEESVSDEMPIAEEMRKMYARKSKKDWGKKGDNGMVDGVEVDGSAVDHRLSRKRRSGVVEEEAEELQNDERKSDTSSSVDEVEIVRDKDREEVEETTLAVMQSKVSQKSKRKKHDRKKQVILRGEEGEANERRRMMVDTGELEVMTVEDSEFYDFDLDRVERCFKKAQVWAIYDDDDGMPRHYGLIEEVVSVKPFEVKMSWLDFQNDGDERLVSWEKMGFHVSCGKFKVARKDTVKLLNIFSHLVECDRATRELYRIYPKKGSIWALYNERALDVGGRDSLSREQRNFDIVVFLTSYSEEYGLSMAYLEKVDGYKTVFKRREVGYNAIKWLQKVDSRLFSHQIPARKLSGDEASDIPGDRWELDPASLPELVSITK